jgi:hypothetical protein
MADDDLEVLAPDESLEIAGEAVTVREYRFLTGLRVDAIAKPLRQELVALFADAEAGDFDYAALAAVFGKHPNLVRDLIALSVERPAAWVDQLNDTDGQALLMTWWRVNSHFFVHRLAPEILVRRKPGVLAGVVSSPH